MPAFELISDLHAETLQGGRSDRRPRMAPSFSLSFSRPKVTTTAMNIAKTNSSATGDNSAGWANIPGSQGSFADASVSSQTAGNIVTILGLG